MPGYRSPGPQCQARGWFDDHIDRGTSALTNHPPPSIWLGNPAGRIPVSERIDHGLAGLKSVDQYGATWTGRAQGREFHLHVNALEALRRLRAAAREAGFDTQALLYLTSDYRSPAKQNRLARHAREKYGSAENAGVFVAQGHSEHVTGLAMDLYLGISNSGENAKARAFDTLPVYRWLRSYLPNVGLNPYPWSNVDHPGEPWHVSFNVTPF